MNGRSPAPSVRPACTSRLPWTPPARRPLPEGEAGGASGRSSKAARRRYRRRRGRGRPPGPVAAGHPRLGRRVRRPPAMPSEVLDAAERFVWSFPEVEVTDTPTRSGWSDESAGAAPAGPAPSALPALGPGQRGPARGAGRRARAPGRHRRTPGPAHRHRRRLRPRPAPRPRPFFLPGRRGAEALEEARVRLQAAVVPAGPPEAHPPAALRGRPGRGRRPAGRGHPAGPAGRRAGPPDDAEPT